MGIRDKKRILFIIWSYTYGGGAEALLTQIVNHLNPEKYDISIVEYEHADIKVEPTNANIHILPPIEAVETPEHRSKTYQLFNEPELLIDTYIRGEYDLYVSFNYQIPTFLLPKGANNISWIHSDVYDLADPKVLREKHRQDVSFGNVKKIVAISDLTFQSLVDLFPQHQDKMIKIYNGIDVSYVRRKAEEKTDVVMEHPALIFVGRLEERKDPVRLVNVLKRVHEYRNDVHLYYLGQGQLLDELINVARENGLMGFVHFFGYYENPFPIMKQCDICCLLSKSEGFSMCLLEAVALDKPFVATPIGGAKELSNDERCGRIVQTDEDAAKAIVELLNLDKRELQSECRKSIARFDLNHYIEQIETLFDMQIEEAEQKE